MSQFIVLENCSPGTIIVNDSSKSVRLRCDHADPRKLMNPIIKKPWIPPPGKSTRIPPVPNTNHLMASRSRNVGSRETITNVVNRQFHVVNPRELAFFDGYLTNDPSAPNVLTIGGGWEPRSRNGEIPQNRRTSILRCNLEEVITYLCEQRISEVRLQKEVETQKEKIAALQEENKTLIKDYKNLKKQYAKMDERLQWLEKKSPTAVEHSLLGTEPKATNRKSFEVNRDSFESEEITQTTSQRRNLERDESRRRMHSKKEDLENNQRIGTSRKSSRSREYEERQVDRNHMPPLHSYSESKTQKNGRDHRKASTRTGSYDLAENSRTKKHSTKEFFQMEGPDEKGHVRMPNTYPSSHLDHVRDMISKITEYMHTCQIVAKVFPETLVAQQGNLHEPPNYDPELFDRLDKVLYNLARILESSAGLDGGVTSQTALRKSALTLEQMMNDFIGTLKDLRDVKQLTPQQSYEMKRDLGKLQDLFENLRNGRHALSDIFDAEASPLRGSYNEEDLELLKMRDELQEKKAEVEKMREIIRNHEQKLLRNINSQILESMKSSRKSTIAETQDFEDTQSETSLESSSPELDSRSESSEEETAMMIQKSDDSDEPNSDDELDVPDEDEEELARVPRRRSDSMVDYDDSGINKSVSSEKVNLAAPNILSLTKFFDEWRSHKKD